MLAFAKYNKKYVEILEDMLNDVIFHKSFVDSPIFLFNQLLQHLHSENKLGKRFPIGLEEQIQKWDADKIRKFHERWYFPANATLYLVGDIDNIPKTVYQIEVCLLCKLFS